MKKNIALAMVAFVFAVGSALASRVFAPEHVFVHAQFGNQQSEIVCIDTQVSCEQSSAGVCTVTVPLAISPFSAVASSTGTNKTYKSGCTVVLGNPTDVSLTSPLTGSDRPNRILQ